jgi:hypothetical protein
VAAQQQQVSFPPGHSVTPRGALCARPHTVGSGCLSIARARARVGARPAAATAGGPSSATIPGAIVPALGAGDSDKASGAGSSAPQHTEQLPGCPPAPRLLSR